MNVECVVIQQKKNVLKKIVFVVQTSMKNQENGGGMIEYTILLCIMWSL